jgi:nitrous oxidase accessory protein NosD
MVADGWALRVRRLVTVVLLLAGPARARLLVVAPGPGAPLQGAIDQAGAGDTIRLAPGVFNEAVVVTKALRIVGAYLGSSHDRTAPNLTTVDGGCTAPYVIDVAADHVRLERLDLVRGSEGAVRISGRTRVNVWDLRPHAVQGDASLSCGTEQYGFNVSGGGKIKLAGGTVRGDLSVSPTGLGFLRAGIRIANVVATGRVEVRDYISEGNTVGVLIEDTVGRGVKLQGLTITAADTGILLRNADAVTVRRNTVDAANGLSADVGVRLDESCNANRLSRNELTGSTLDLLDEGWGNCWRHTIFITGALPAFNCL